MKIHRRRLLAVVCVLGVVAGCGPDEREPAPVRSDNSANGQTSDAADNGSTTDAGDETDTGSSNNPLNNSTADMDAADMGGADTGGMGFDLSDLPVGEVCPYTDRPDFVGICEPVGDAGCPQDEACQLVVYLVGNDTRFSADCQPLPAAGQLSEGEQCVGLEAQCAPGLVCINFYDECRPICYADTSAGCDPGEFCRSPSVSWGGLGFCDSTCNL